jgi:hypothetical protein
MIEDQDKDVGGTPGGKKGRTLAGILATAMDMEEQIAGGVYDEYLERENWPERLEDDIFETIRGFLTTLIDDTRKHKQILSALAKKYGHES